MGHGQDKKHKLSRWWTYWIWRFWGLAAVVWFLARVIPKPTRAAYPCQRAALPIAAGFIGWIASGLSSVLAFHKAKSLAGRSRWLGAAVASCLAVAGSIVFFSRQQVPVGLAQGLQGGFVPTDPPNNPMGKAFGIKPGRVVWCHDPNAARWDGLSNQPSWWDDRYTDPEVVANMLADAIRSVAGADSVKQAWQRIFQDYNQRAGRGPVGYTKGERIAIKLNLNQCRDHGDCGNASYITPQLVLALIGQLVNDVGVEPNDITCYDAVRCVPSTIFDRATKAFPGVNFVDSRGGNGRQKAIPSKEDPLYLQAGEVIYLPTCLVQARYLINVAGLKGHTLAGMTVCAKNHLGSMLNEDGTNAAPTIHRYLTVRSGRRAGSAQQMGQYNGLVDLNGHKHIGGKTILYLIDAIYATRHNEYRLDPSCKWQSAPFNNHWTCSILASQDGVAIDSVALDLLRNEPSLRDIVTGAVDNYLHEAAEAGQPPSKYVYDPERDGRGLSSLGVHEHWNNPVDKKYSRNLGKTEGIELVLLGSAGR